MTLRSHWPVTLFFVSVAALVLGVVLGLVAGLASHGGPQRGGPFAAPDPTHVVLQWDRAFRQGDCGSFRATTTAQFRQDYGQAEADYSTCEGFRDGIEEIEHNKPDDFWRTYRTEIRSVEIDGDRARVETEESWEYLDGDRTRTASETYTYDLVLIDGRWLIDDASFLHHGDELEV